MLEMRPSCERCGRALGHADEAYVCSFECTFCPACEAGLGSTCPNSVGELVRRPKRRPRPDLERPE